jgi:enoyl-CoA hydratase
LALATRVTQRSAPLVRRTKQTLQTTLAATTFEEAFSVELDAQEWSVNQPEFADTVRRVQAEIAARKTRVATISPREGT